MRDSYFVDATAASLNPTTIFGSVRPQTADDLSALAAQKIGNFLLNESKKCGSSRPRTARRGENLKEGKKGAGGLMQGEMLNRDKRLADYRGPEGAKEAGEKVLSDLEHKGPAIKSAAVARSAVKTERSVADIARDTSELATKETNMKELLPRVGTRTLSKEGTGIAAKLATKETAEIAAKTGGKMIVKKVPVVGFIAGVGFGALRALQGDWLGALMEVGSGAASTIPGAGTVASLGIDAALALRDIPSGMSPEVDRAIKNSNRTAETREPAGLDTLPSESSLLNSPMPSVVQSSLVRQIDVYAAPFGDRRMGPIGARPRADQSPTPIVSKAFANEVIRARSGPDRALFEMTRDYSLEN